MKSLRIGTLRPAKGATHPRKRRGLGTGSGVGGTSGRGHKGQLARSGGKVHRWFEGGQMPLTRRLPKMGFTPIQRVPRQIVNLTELARFEKGATITRASLKAMGLIDKTSLPVKILGNGEISIALTFQVDAVSSTAKEKIEAAGGTITLPTPVKYRPRHVKKARD
ncbi:MAG TPA: 50S ribosomal protein L15 [Candidatus Eisenbacteria bacterium]|nr:50S ribosomal protein L15 [Candidatus Eisenbacteria bacterium]